MDFLNDTTTYMDQEQLDYFRNKLIGLKRDLEDTIKMRAMELRQDSIPIEDMEKSVAAFSKGIALQTQARALANLCCINKALERIQDGSYGFCLETDEPIGLRRLEANPVAMYCVEYQNSIESADFWI